MDTATSRVWEAFNDSVQQMQQNTSLKNDIGPTEQLTKDIDEECRDVLNNSNKKQEVAFIDEECREVTVLLAEQLLLMDQVIIIAIINNS